MYHDTPGKKLEDLKELLKTVLKYFDFHIKDKRKQAKKKQYILLSKFD